MEKEKHHLIQGLQVEISVANKQTGQAAADQTQDIIKNKIIPITEKVLDEWSDENTHIQPHQVSFGREERANSDQSVLWDAFGHRKGSKLPDVALSSACWLR